MTRFATHGCDRLRFWTALVVAAWLVTYAGAAALAADQPLFNDSHLHLANYVQQGPPIADFLKTMDTKVGRVALFGTPARRSRGK